MSNLLIVGSGLTGATIARLAHDSGINVTVIEKQAQIGENIKDWVHPASGWRIHKHGPHFFRASSDNIWSFVNRFSQWENFEATLQSWVNGRLVSWPTSYDWIQRNYGTESEINGNSNDLYEPKNFADVCLRMIPRQAYEDLIASYIRRMWDVEPENLHADLAKRIEIRRLDDPRNNLCKHQGIPSYGYDALMKNMLKIRVHTGVEFQKCKSASPANAIDYDLAIFTGAIDELFEFEFGKLRYRAMRRRHIWRHHRKNPILPSTCVVYPNVPSEYLRATEWNTFIPHRDGALITLETAYTPESSDEYEYPFPGLADKKLYEKYVEKATVCYPDIIFAGRLGEYRYMDMHQAIGRAMMLFNKKILPRLKGEI